MVTYNELPQAMTYLIELMEDLNGQIRSHSRREEKVSRILSFSETLKFLNERGFRVSKSKLYKLTSNGTIPCKHFGNRLVFNAEELLNWCESQLKSKDKLNSEATLAIVNDAQRKMFNCKNKKDGK